MKEVAIAAVWLVGAVAYLAYRKPKTYRDLHPIFVTLTCCVAAFFLGAHIGGDAARNDLAMFFVDDDDVDAAAQVGGNAIPLFEALLVCTAALGLFFAVRFVLEIVESAED